MRHIAKSWLFHPLLERELKLARQAVKSRRLSSRDLCIGIAGDFFYSKPRRRLEKPNRTPLRGSSCKRSATKVLIARWLVPPPGLEHLPSVPLNEPSRRERLEAETDLFGYAVSGHPLELSDNIAWNSYCPVAGLNQFVGQTVTTCGLIV